MATQYVKLPERLSQGCFVDTNEGTGFAISGLDVVEVDDDSATRRLVRKMVRSGQLVEATKAEFEEVQKHHQALAEAHEAAVIPGYGSFWQEATIQKAVEKAHAELEKSRKKRARANDEEESKTSKEPAASS